MDQPAEAKGSASKTHRQGVGSQADSKRREYRGFRRPNKGPNDLKATTQNPESSINQLQETREGNQLEKPSNRPEKKPPPCRFFRSKAGCLRGDECKFPHIPRKVKNDKKPQNREVETTSSAVKIEESLPEALPSIFMPSKFENKKFIPLKHVVTADARGTEEALNIRKTEINYYRRRYPRSRLMDTPELTTIGFIFEPTDPEWSFAVREIFFTVEFPKDFPLQPMNIRVDKGENSALPDILCGHIEAGVRGIIKETFDQMKEKDAYEGVGKTLLRWIDRNIFQLFLQGLRRTKLVFDASAAGISLVYSGETNLTVKKPLEQKEVKNLVNVMSQVTLEEKEKYSETESDGEEASNESSSDENDDEHLGIEENNDGEVDPPAFSLPDSQPAARLPIEVAMLWNDFTKNIASISPVYFQLVVRCARCSEHNEIEVPVKDIPKYRRCTRCNVAYSIRMRSEIVHENSNILAQCDARSCRPIDCVLLNSKFKFACFACGKEDAIQKIGFGEAHRSWCRACHTLCNFVISAIRFQGDFSKTTQKDELAAKALPKPKKTVEKSVGIVAGQPLPDLGTCSHYKKSYRWFRFPCCGKVFPCDECHNLKEKGHEMKLANRMICGHCSTEQPFMKNKPCTSCENNVTRTRSQYWEGGKGCRDQTKMSRNDARKHTNSRRKTTSSKKAALLVVKPKS